MRIYLDMCSIQRPFDDRAQVRVVVEAEAILGVMSLCESGEAILLGSDALLAETERNPHPGRRHHAERILSRAQEFIALTGDLNRRALRYEDRGIDPMDALHLAAAVEGKADYFCTCDDRLLRRAKAEDTGATKPVSPLELIEEVGR